MDQFMSLRLRCFGRNKFNEISSNFAPQRQNMNILEFLNVMRTQLSVLPEGPAGFWTSRKVGVKTLERWYLAMGSRRYLRQIIDSKRQFINYVVRFKTLLLECVFFVCLLFLLGFKTRSLTSENGLVSPSLTFSPTSRRSFYARAPKDWVIV